ncbi:hypothetical protein [Flexilinea flocculi]|uniref:hypothetical protein n=1 Tax=Flexilinea flocculi TaxID=1678840 RepID=UPI0007820385|nr:hypothetical protein [Flexilinea flocculi]
MAGTKEAYLAALTLTHTSAINRFDRNINLTSFHIDARNDLQRLERLKKSSIEAFYYYFQAIELLSK